MAFTSVKSAAGNWPANAVQAAYDTLFNYAFKAGTILEPLIDKTPGNPTSPGSSITMYVNQYFNEASVTAATTPLDEETDVTADALPQSTSVTLTPTEYGKAVAATQKLNARTLTPVNPVMAALVAQHARDTIDRLVETKIRTGSNIIYGGGVTADNLIDNTKIIKATNIRRAVTKLHGASVPTRDGQFYVGVFHPDQIHDLREETGSGAWRTPNEYGFGDVANSPILTGEFGEFEGVRFVSNPRSLWAADMDAGAGAGGAANASVYHGYILGKEALCKAEVLAPTTVVTPVIDRLQRFYGLGWKADVAYGVYRNESLWQVRTGSSLGA